jgi:hypothetical protein
MSDVLLQIPEWVMSLLRIPGAAGDSWLARTVGRGTIPETGTGEREPRFVTRAAGDVRDLEAEGLYPL